MDLTDYTAYDASGLAELIKSGAVSAGEVRAAALAAINQVQPHINAAAADPWPEPLAYDTGGRFSGVPFGLKDLVCHAAGVPCRMGVDAAGIHQGCVQVIPQLAPVACSSR
jgi:amidase